MVDRGERIPLAERKRRTKVHISDLKKDIKMKAKGKGNRAVQLLIILLILGVFAQNSGMISKMNKLLGQSETTVHEIYDDTAVIKAYKTGDTSGLDEKDLFVHDKMSEVIKKLITDDMSPYEKEKAIYDWQVKWTSYNDQSLNPIVAGGSETHTPYGVLRSHNAICVGNATTFKLFMDALDIPCKIIHSTQNGEHAWDVVQLDGEWYHVDVTFDGGVSGEPGYNYFNMPDSVKDNGSYPWDHDEIPAANGTKYCYMLTSAAALNDMYEIPAKLKQAINGDKTMLTFTLKDNSGFTRQIAEYICNSFPIDNGWVGFADAYSLGGQTVYKYTIERYENGGGEIPPEVLSRLDEAIADANDGMIAGAAQ